MRGEFREFINRPSYMYITIISNIFFSETSWQINAEFHVVLSWAMGNKVYINGTGHMTKMATMPIYGKHL